MTKTLRSCKRCGSELPDHVARFSVADGSQGTVTGVFCSPRHWLEMQYGPAEVETAYVRAFVPVERIHADADNLQPEEKITA